MDVRNSDTKLSTTGQGSPSRAHYAIDEAIPGAAPVWGNSLAFPQDQDPAGPTVGPDGGSLV